jgi:hypothetical protein
VLRASPVITVKCASEGKQCPSSSARSANAVITSFCVGATDNAQAQSRATRLTAGRSREGAEQRRQDRAQA